MSESPEALLARHFGFEEFLPGQREVIRLLLDGESAVAVFPTGGGKSLCYQLPALELSGTTLVVSPLIALMKDQIDALVARGHGAVRLDSSLSREESIDAISRIRSGEVKLLYVAPERFNNERFRETLTGLHVSLFAVDEAHCISEWGHNFRPDYLKLVRYAADCGAERVLALTATATDAVLEDIRRSFSIPASNAVRTPFYRANLRLLFQSVKGDRFDMLRGGLAERPPGATIVYTTQQRTAEEIADRLAELGFPARAYHAGLDTEVRNEVQEWFFSRDDAIVVATIAFGMGIDKPDIRYLYHFNLPKSLESYSQEIGRAGRDGEPSVCELFASLDDLTVLENFVHGDTPSVGSLRALLDALFGAESDQLDFSLYELSSRSDMRQLVVGTALTYLELDGYLEVGTPYYSRYQFVPLASSKEILSDFEGERRDLLAHLFRSSEKKRKWFTLDIDRAAKSYGAPRDRAVRALDYLAEQGLLELRAQGVRRRYRRLRQPESLDDLTASLAQRFLKREAAEIERLGRVVALIENDGCQVSALGEYFSQPLDLPCGHCSWCESGGQAIALPQRARKVIDESTIGLAFELRAEQPEALAEPRAVARFLCGLGSPGLSRARLGRHSLAGALRDTPFREVLERVERAFDCR